MTETLSSEYISAENLFRKGLSLFYEENAAEAAEYFRQAAEQEHPEAACFFGYCCEEGLGVPQDPQTAILYYRQAEEIPYSSCRLGVSAETAGELRKAAEYYLQCLDNLSSESENSDPLLVDPYDVCLRLGCCLQALPQADRPYFAPSPMKCFMEAYGHAGTRKEEGNALFRQGYLYLFGIETKADPAEGISLLTEAAGYGNEPAAELLAEIHRWEQIPEGCAGDADSRFRREEALLRLRILERKGVDPQVYRNFYENDLPGYAADDCRGFSSFSPDAAPEIQNAIEMLERRNMTVYFIHESLTLSYGRMISLFYVSSDPLSWPDDRRDLLYGRPIAAVVNLTDDFTEIGAIAFQISDDLMERLY